MGSIITAKCNKCDFIKKDIYIGCGMTDHKVWNDIFKLQKCFLLK
ncbi:MULTISPECIES: hypothetical protein [Arcobacteraceae]|uniref:Uncharacterized protein n=1 Tax=bioreactor metagenome TaxID=1076179 RepID=A0A644UWF8_9ZZZZ|nr:MULTISPECIES: hypothetical protein [Arcobacteraceae]MCT7562327.1 hypothetical protein [Aliarcobacter butzleri]MCT7912201.1 hypothetical protein [Arcobacter lacus]MDK2047847.1 hypothetical protein [Aliarcobacter butzleri]